MNPVIALNVNLFCHIELDFALAGIFGVQGNTFANTVGYFLQYLDTLSDVKPDVIRLAHKMQELVRYEAILNDLNQGLKHQADHNRFEAYIDSLAEQLLALPEQNDLILPGGWSNHSGGHAMIYQWTKTESGLQLDIYNSGAGANQHEQYSTQTKEHFFPVKAYVIPLPAESLNFKQLLRDLFIPMLSNNSERAIYNYDEESLSGILNARLVPLKGNRIPVSDKINLEITTAGQITGTCAQRSIHQILKVYIKPYAQYQHFMSQFKLFTLREFIRTHPEPRSEAIAKLIVEAIDNNLKIIKQVKLYSDIEKMQLTNELLQLKQSVLDNTAIRQTSIIRKPGKQYLYLINNSREIPILEIENTAYEQKRFFEPPTFNLSLPPLAQLQQLFTECEDAKERDPLGIVLHLENLLNQLPFNILQVLDDSAELRQALKLIEQLQRMYLETVKANNFSQTRKLVTRWSLLALYEQGATCLEHLIGKPAFITPFRLLQLHLGAFRYSVALGTQDPVLDQRIQALRTHYLASHIFDESNTYTEKTKDFNFFEYYIQMINRYPELKSKLLERAASNPTFVEPWKSLEEKENIVALAFFIEHQEELAMEEEFLPFLEMLQDQLNTEKFLCNHFEMKPSDLEWHEEAGDASGVVLMDEKTQIQSFLQGCKRMRGLEDAQTIEIIVPQALASLTIEDIIRF